MKTPLSAAFEAHLRGGEVYDHPVDGLFIRIPKQGHMRIIDPTTPAGAWDALDLIGPHYEVVPVLGGGFICRPQDSSSDHWGYGATRQAAVTAAWNAAAEDWSKA